MTLRVAVFADDLSGGNAVGAEFARTGLRTLVLRSTQATIEPADGLTVLVVSTDTRNRSDPEAAAILREVAPRVLALRPDIVIKKLDSLLRGPIGAEAEALTALMDPAGALVVAASPATGRHTVAGRQRAGGRPLLEVMPELDPSVTLVSDEVGAHFTSCALPVRHLPLDVLRANPVRHAFSGCITVADCETQDDLDRAVRAAHDAGIGLFFGTYGLGEAVAHLLAPAGRSPLLIVAGSLSDATREQVRVLGSEADCDVVPVSDPAAAQVARESLSNGRDVVLCARPDTLGTAEALHGPPSREAASAMERHLAELATPLLPLVSGLIVSGGSTADALLARMKARGLSLTERELSPGVPLMRVHGGAWDGLPCITKPGSFGGSDVLQVARCCLKES